MTTEDNRASSMTSSKSSLSELITHEPQSLMKQMQHQFLVKTFSSPTKCTHCTSLMVGLMRQGMVCEMCGFTCHTACLSHVPAVCPLPTNQIKKPLSIYYTRGIGTAYEGYLKVSKQGEVKKGWVRQFVVVSDYKLFLYDIPADLNALPSSHATQVLDMRDPLFSVSSVEELDVIDANKEDIPCIFKVTTSLWKPSNQCNCTLILADTEDEKHNLLMVLEKLHTIMKRNYSPDKRVIFAKELIDNTLTLLRNTTSAVIIDQNRIVLGTEEGMYCIDFDRLEIARIGKSKKIYQIECINDKSLLVVVSDEEREVSLVPIEALDDDDVEWIKVTGGKGCLVLAVGYMPRASSKFFLSISVKMQENCSLIITHQITSTKTRHHQIRVFGLPVNVQSLQLLSDGRLCVGSPSCFTVHNIQYPDPQIISLLHRENPLYETIASSSVEAVRVVELPRHEYLLVFGTFAAYVDQDGKKSRDREIMYPAVPTAIAYREGHLIVYSDSHIDVFNCATSEWVQTANIKKAKPLNDAGTLTISFLNDLAHLLYFSNIHPSKLLTRDNISVIGSSLSPREGNRSKKRPVISAPMNFRDVCHIGLSGDLFQKLELIDLPTRFDR